VVRKNKENDVIKLKSLNIIEIAKENEMNKLFITSTIMNIKNRPWIVFINCRTDFAKINNGNIEPKIISMGITSMKTNASIEITIA